MKQAALLIGGGVLAVIAVILGAGVYISPQDELKKSSAVVAVSGGDTKARALEAVRLYKEGWAPRLIFSGAALDPNSPSNAHEMRQMAVAEGIPPDVVLVDELSINTYQNADEVSYIIEALDYESIILVTSPYHQRRTYIEFKNHLGEGVEIINHSAPDQKWSRRGWWSSPSGWYLTLSELPKVIYALSR